MSDCGIYFPPKERPSHTDPAIQKSFEQEGASNSRFEPFAFAR